MLDVPMKAFRSTRSAFSLMELLAVIVILGIIAALIVPRVTIGTDQAKDKACEHNRTEINITVEQFYLHNAAWLANNLSDVAIDPNDLPDGVAPWPVAGEPYRRGPTPRRRNGLD